MDIFYLQPEMLEHVLRFVDTASLVSFSLTAKVAWAAAKTVLLERKSDFSTGLQRAIASVKARLETFKKHNKQSSHKFFHEAIASAVLLANQTTLPELTCNVADIGRTLSHCYVLIREVSRESVGKNACLHVGRLTLYT